MNLIELVAKLTLDTSEYDKGLKESKRKAQSWQETALNSAAKVGKVATAAMAAAGGAVMAFGAKSVKTGMNFDKSMSQVAATMGKTVDEISELRDFAQEMGRTTAFSATQAADALNYMALAGYDTAESMSMLPNVLNLAAAGNMDLAKASDMVTDAQTAFGLEMEEMPQLIDEMAKAASTGNTSVEQLGDAFLTIGGLAQELNGGMVTLADGTTAPVSGIQEMEIALTAMANAGVKGSEAGTHMRNMLLKLASPTSDGTKALEAMGVSVFDTEGKMRSLSDIFGDLNGELSNMTQEQKIQAISDLFNTRDLASAEALLNAVGEDWNEIGTSILDAEGAAGKMAETQLDNLAGDVTLFKSALEGAQIALSDGIAPALRDFVKSGTKGLSEFTEKLKEGDFAGAAEAIGNALGNVITQAIGKIPDLLSAGGALLKGIADGITANSQTLFTSGLNAIGKLITGVGKAMPSIIATGGKLVGNLLVGMAQALPNLIIGGINLITGVIQGIGQGEGNLVSKVFEIITTVIGALVSATPEILAAIWNLLVAIVKAFEEINWVSVGLNILRGVLSGIKNVAPMILNTVSNLVQKILKHFGFTGLAAKVGAAFDNVKKTITDKLEAAEKKVSDWIKKIKNMFPFNIGKIFSGWVPKVSLKASKSSDGSTASTNSTVGREDFAKAMIQPYMFKRPTEFYAGEAGDEVLYGKKALMGDISEAVGEGVKTANIYNTIYVNGAEDPEVWAGRLVRQMQLDMRMA